MNANPTDGPDMDDVERKEIAELERLARRFLEERAVSAAVAGHDPANSKRYLDPETARNPEEI